MATDFHKPRRTRGLWYDAEMFVTLTVLMAELLAVCAISILFVWYFSSEVRSTFAGAPFVPTSAKSVEPILEMLHLGPDDTLADLGCGDGRIIDAALRSGVKEAIGYEVAWMPLFLARRRLKHWGERAKLIQQDARKGNLSSATAVYMYLLPKIVDTLAPRLASQLKSGTRVLSASFPIDVSKHSSFRLLEERKTGRITSYLYERV